MEKNRKIGKIIVKYNWGYDQNIASEIKDIKVQLVEELTKEKEKAVEMARKLLVENRDLKDYLVENGLMTKDYKLVRWY